MDKIENESITLAGLYCIYEHNQTHTKTNRIAANRLANARQSLEGYLDAHTHTHRFTAINFSSIGRVELSPTQNCHG